MLAPPAFFSFKNIMPEPAPKLRFHRLRRGFPPALLLAAAGAIAWTQWTDKVENGFRFPLILLTLIVTGGLLSLWLLAASGYRWRVRLGVLAGGMAALIATGMLFRIDGYSGDMLPRLAWRWAPPSDYLLSAANASPSNASQAADAGDAPIALAGAKDFPRFLGPDGDATLKGPSVATDWRERPPRELWRQPIGAGWSAFAVVGGRAVTQEQRGDDEMVVCYDLATGNVLWSRANRVRFSETMGGDGPRATPTIDQGKVYVMGATGILERLDLKTGTVDWRLDTLAETETPNLMWAKSCSPLLVDDLVIVSLGDSADRSLAAYGQQAGELRWRAGADKPSYATPVLTALAGRRQILSVNAQSVSAHEPESGELLWQFPWAGQMAKCSQPVPLSDSQVFLSAGYGVGCELIAITANDQGALAPKSVWTNRQMKTRFTNVAVREGFAYGLDDGVLACLDLSDGRRRWKAGRYGHGQVLAVGDTLVVQAETGEVVLVRATPERHEELARLSALSDKTWNNPVLAGKYLLLRNDREAVCYELTLAD